MRNSVVNPFLQFNLPNVDKAAGLCKLYLGVKNATNPEANQVQAYAVLPDGSELPIAQPITLSAGGVAMFNGSPVEIRVAVDEYSLKLTTSAGAQLYYDPSVKTSVATADLGAADSAVSIAGIEASKLAKRISGYVDAKEFGAVGNGVTDDTDAIQAAIDFVSASGGGEVVISDGDYRIDVDKNPTSDDFGGIKLKDNVTLNIHRGARLRAFASDKTFTCVVQAYKVSNVAIIGGGTIQGEKSIHIGTTGEHGMGVAIFGSTGVVVDGVTIEDCWGDAVYSGYSNEGGVYTPARRIYIRNNTMRNCRRQGISVVYTDVFEITGNTIIDIQGAAPEAAIDLEPDTASRANSNGTVSDNQGFNTGQGFTMYVKNQNIVVSNNIFRSRGVSFRSVNAAINVRVDGNVFESTTYGSESCCWIDSGVFEELGTLNITDNTFVNGGSNGCIYVTANANRVLIKDNVISVDRAQLVPLVIAGNATVLKNNVTLSGLALSGANKNAVFAERGTFSGNRFINLTSETPQFLYIGTSQILPDDTRRGTWMPTLITTGTPFTGVTYNVETSASFVKTGSVVFIQGYIRTTSIDIGAATGQLRIGNLPFPAIESTASLRDKWSSISVGFAQDWATLNPTSGLLASGENSIRLINSDASGLSSELTVANASLTGGNVMYFSGTYETSDKT